MDKEKIITIGIGLLVGITAATIYFLATRYLPARQSQDKATFAPASNHQATTLTLALNKPDDNFATTSSTIAVIGTTLPGARLVLFANADEKIASADGQGRFSADIKLEEGGNEISVTAMDDKSNALVVKRSITLEIPQ